LILGKNSKQNLPSKRPLFTRWGRIETRARADGGKEEEEEKKKKKKKKKTMDPLPTTASLKRDVQWALLGSTTGRQSSVLEKRIQSAVDAVAFCACFSSSLPTREEEEEEDDDSEEEEEEEEELAKIETLAHFFYQCASVDLTPRGFDERLDVVCPPGGDDDDVNDDIVRSIPTETKRALRDAYVKNKTRLTRACRNLAEMEDEKTMERIEKVEWRMDVETSSRMRQNRGGGGGGGDDIVGDRLRYVVKVTLRRLNENYVAERRVDVFECSYDALKKLSEEVEKCLEKSEDARAKRIRRFVRRPTT